MTLPTINSVRLDHIMYQLINLDDNDPNYDEIFDHLISEYDATPGSDSYRHDRPRDIPFLLAYDHTIKLMQIYRTNDETYRNVLLNLSPKIVKYALDKYYNEGSLFDSYVMDIYKHGWETQIRTMTETTPRLAILEMISDSITDQGL